MWINGTQIYMFALLHNLCVCIPPSRVTSKSSIFEPEVGNALAIYPSVWNSFIGLPTVLSAFAIFSWRTVKSLNPDVLLADSRHTTRTSNDEGFRGSRACLCSGISCALAFRFRIVSGLTFSYNFTL
ncbi:uncharacterized protein OCT59_012621 [Rhizophagus irregularis]|uniref:uncharacterized protein n=1 Tax=Rhizophagus irregularis TaxID=588596 RepID=UPI00333486E6|nr:hypothetical protein OCT59_012621 [Rhizophagus irregularis]